MDYMSEYKRWLESDALSDDERAELRAVEGNNEEIESRFFAPLSFGTAGLRADLPWKQQHYEIICRFARLMLY